MPVIDDYLGRFDPSQKAALQHIRQLVHATVPEAEEIISYGMPGFKYKGKYLVGFNAFKNHLSLFPTSHPIEAFKDQLGDYKTATGTIQFTVEQPIPDALIKELLQVRITDIEA